MTRRGLVRYRGRGGLLGCCLLFAACGGTPQDPVAPQIEERAPVSAPVAPGESAEESRQTELPAAPPAPSLSTLTRPGSVLAGRELGMVITGVETGGPTRSLEVLEGQILAFLPQLQEVYEQERVHDAGLMGSIDVSMTIAPEGRVSDLRFPRTRVSSDKLVAAVFDRMRTWTFPPAEGRVQLRYTLLFVPPGVDQASILIWEKHLGSRLVVDRSGEGDAAVAAASLPEPGPPPAPKREAAATVKPAKRPTPPVPSRAPVESARRWESPTGWYRVIRSSALYAAPREAADIITQLRPGTRVQVVKVVDGEWLEVRSVSNRPPGFLRRSDARPLAEVGRSGEGSRF